jgi:hypothetical protein
MLGSEGLFPDRQGALGQWLYLIYALKSILKGLICS